ncbi:MAG TPA: radical SAM protein, partial [bacterium]|nr:radical SAM protein [bacterium]
MKVCFIQKQIFPYFGVMSVSEAVKHKGHESEILIYALEKEIESQLLEIEPDVIAFSVLSSEHKWLRKISLEVKRILPGVTVIAGGIHALMYPADILELPAIDYVCYGEGEKIFPLLLDNLAAGTPPEGIRGIGFKEDGRPLTPEPAELINNLDSFGEDRALYYERYPALGNLPQKYFISSRGCPFECEFCANRYIKEAFRDCGKYIRRKSPGCLVSEVKKTVVEYGAVSIAFADDLFIYDPAWLREFGTLYKKEVGIPYFVTARADLITEENAACLADSGCHALTCGLETGSETLRMRVLKKNITNDRYRKCAQILDKYGIELQTSNMFCLPDEDVEAAVSTIDLNMKIGARYMFTTLFLPFPETDLADYCIRKKYLKPGYTFSDMPESFIFDSVLDIEDKEK